MPAGSAAMPVLFLLSGPKIDFLNVAPINAKFWHGGADQKLTTASMNIYATYSTYCNVTLTLSMTSCCDVTLKVSDITAASTLHLFR